MRNLKHKDPFYKIRSCQGCDLSKHRTNLVIGRGIFPAKLLFIGEGPGESEDMLAEAFIGLSGKLLDQMIYDACSLIKIKEPPSYFITNTVLCRPWIWDENDPDFKHNRAPNKEEALSCMQNILKIYLVVRPEFVIFVGKIAETYYKKEFTEAIRITHPAAHLRYGGKASPTYDYDVRNLSEVFKGFLK